MKQTILAKLKKIKFVKKRKRVKKPKPVKKNTWKRKLKAWELKSDRRQQQRTTALVEADRTERVCSNCGEQYTGRLCPQCGQPGTWTRFTWKQTVLNLLDIWGLGNRPMFRTLKELFWRPGYMVRDYLHGHRQFYFPPFKLLAVSIIMLIFVGYVLVNVLRAIYGDAIDLSDLTPTSMFASLVKDLESRQLSGNWRAISDACLWLFKLLSKNILYEWLFLAVFLVACIWIAFRRVGKRYNFVETYIFIIFILCLKTLLLTIAHLGTGFCLLVESPAVSLGASSTHVHPSVFLSALAFIYSIVVGLVAFAFTVLRYYLFALSFKQFYGLSWKSTILHFFLSVLVACWIIVVVALFIVLFIDETSVERLQTAVSLFMLILIPAAFIFADIFLRKNQEQVNQIVSNVCKGSMLSVICAYPLGWAFMTDNYTFLSIIAMSLVYVALAVGLSLLPVLLYKKYHRTWLACLPCVLVVALLILQFHFFY